MTPKQQLMIVEANNLSYPVIHFGFDLEAGYKLEQRIRKGGAIKRIVVELRSNC